MNVFTYDKDVVAHYKFRGNTPFDDVSGNGNHLYRQGGTGYVNKGCPLLNTVSMRPGYSGCVQFDGIERQGLRNSDLDLMSGFPGKNGESNTTFSFTLWFKPSSFEPYTGSCLSLIAKYNNTNYSYLVAIGDTTHKVNIYWGYNGGLQQYAYTINRALTLGVWYFLKVVYDDANNICSGYLFDSSNSNWYTISGAPVDSLNINNESFYVGRSTYGHYYSGLIQDLCVFDDIVTDAQAEAIKDGSYNLKGDPHLLCRYMFDKQGLGWDWRENCHLHSCPIPDYPGPRGNIHCLFIDGDYCACVWRKDSDLSSNFPTKFGSSNDQMSVCFWMSPTVVNPPANIVYPVSKGVIGNESWKAGWWNLSASIKIGQTACVPVVGQWYHITFTYDGSNYRCYVYDLAADLDYLYVGGAISFLNVPFAIGCNMNATQTGPDQYAFYGYIGEQVNFKRVLDDDEIDDIIDGNFGGGAIIYSKPKGSRSYGPCVSRPLIVRG